ncbi:MAG: GTP-dependent dephospho-CoA kinase family protein [Candidatus Diapherotrites archaeon]|nr:GTP-dependent dephospho-CoA kinase family protein [Candidatus Diapherotrites archaeon]
MSYRLTPELRARLKEPFGKLLPEPDWDGEFIAVGDECAFLAAKAGKEPMVTVYDFRIKRKEISEEKREAIEKMPGKTITVDNPAGEITGEAEMAIRLALESKPSKVCVNGEEDLLVLPCIVHAPEGTVVYYGQPDDGAVKVEVTAKKKEEAREIMLSMKEVEQ